MAKLIEDELEKNRALKMNDSDINLLIVLDQTCCLMTNAVELELKHLRITQAQVRVMSMLSRQDRPATLEELAGWCLKEFNSISTLVNRMEKNGIIKKIRKKGDLKTYIALTEKGSILYHREVTERSIRLIFGKLSDEEKKHLDTLLKRVRQTAREVLGLDYRPPFLPE